MENNGFQNIYKYYQSTYLVIKAKVMIVLAHCTDEDESEKLTTGTYL